MKSLFIGEEYPSHKRATKFQPKLDKFWGGEKILCTSRNICKVERNFQKRTEKLDSHKKKKSCRVKGYVLEKKMQVSKKQTKK